MWTYPFRVFIFHISHLIHAKEFVKFNPGTSRKWTWAPSFRHLSSLQPHFLSFVLVFRSYRRVVTPTHSTHDSYDSQNVKKGRRDTCETSGEKGTVNLIRRAAKGPFSHRGRDTLSFWLSEQRRNRGRVIRGVRTQACTSQTTTSSGIARMVWGSVELHGWYAQSDRNVYYESLKWELKTTNLYIWISVWWKTKN